MLGGYGGLERTDVSQFLLWEGVMVLTELISLTVSMLGGCGGLDRTDFFNSFYFGQVWWSCKN